MEQVGGDQLKDAKPPKGAGRIDGGQEAVMKAKPIKDVIDDLVKQYTKARDAAQELSDDIKAAAEKGGVSAKALRSLVAARASENFEERKREVEQLQFLFEKVGE